MWQDAASCHNARVTTNFLLLVLDIASVNCLRYIKCESSYVCELYEGLKSCELSNIGRIQIAHKPCTQASLSLSGQGFFKKNRILQLEIGRSLENEGLVGILLWFLHSLYSLIIMLELLSGLAVNP